MIERPDELDGLYTCREHRTFQGTEVDAAVHLRTIHSELWQKLKQLQVTPLTAPPAPPANTPPVVYSLPHRRPPRRRPRR